jgi:FkbM family methyltransferase
MLVATEIAGGRYELMERGLLRDALDEGDVVLELGAGIGVVSTVCAKRIGSQRVFTFEANPNLIPLAKETFRLNDVAPTIENSVLGLSKGEVRFYLERDFWSSSTVKRSEESREVIVPIRLLTDAIREIRPTFLIVDIEGGEAEIFNTVHLDGVKKVLIELHPHVIGQPAVDHIRKAFVDAGYKPARELANGTQVYYERAAA